MNFNLPCVSHSSSVLFLAFESFHLVMGFILVLQLIYMQIYVRLGYFY